MSRFKAVIFDWAGTMVDFGSFAPMGVFVRAFESFGIEASISEARAPMGMGKRDHIAAMLKSPAIAAQWRERHGRAADEHDIDEIYRVFLPLNESVVAEYGTLIPGALAAVRELRAMGLKIGSTTGYTRSIMETLRPVAEAQGYVPDNIVCSDDLAEGRPGPLGIYKCMVDLAVYPPDRLIKVDDTAPGIAEGVSAGCVTVGVAMSGNHVGMTADEVAALDGGEASRLRMSAQKMLESAGATHVIDTVADLPALVRRLDDG